MIRWAIKEGKIILEKIHVLEGWCSLCKRHYSGNMYNINIVISFTQKPELKMICDLCLRSQSFYYLDQNLNIKYNACIMQLKSTLSQELDAQKGSGE